MQTRTAALACCLLLGLLPDPLAAQEAHITIEKPGDLTAEAGERLYRSIRAEIGAGYAMSDDPVAQGYQRWRRYNTAPYLSATHGNRYVNNYANGIAVRGGYGGGGAMPAGAVLAKDSFTMTDEGKVFAGALFLMEKLRPGLSPGTADWRYWMILPDGSVLGDSEDDSAGEVAFCHSCHQAVARRDYLFFVPKAYREAGGG